MFLPLWSATLLYKKDGILIKSAKSTDLEAIMSKIKKYAGISDVNMTTDQIINLTRD